MKPGLLSRGTYQKVSEPLIEKNQSFCFLLFDITGQVPKLFLCDDDQNQREYTCKQAIRAYNALVNTYGRRSKQPGA